jgi:hypothetical protein
VWFVSGYAISSECEGRVNDMTDSLRDRRVDSGFCDLASAHVYCPIDTTYLETILVLEAGV